MIVRPYVVRPAEIDVPCPHCPDVVTVVIPVEVTFGVDAEGDERIFVTVNDEEWDVQEVWDHRLQQHGPAVDG